MNARERGTITKVDGASGFITPALDGEDGDVFFQRSSISSLGRNGHRSVPKLGDACTFVRGTAPDGRPCAQSIKVELTP